MKISVLGCGRWGSFIAWYLNSIGNEVYSWGPEDGYSYQILKKTGRNEYVALDKKITLTCNLREAVEHADVIVISIGAQGLREFIPKILPYTREEQNFILCMKGIEVDTGKRLSEVMIESGVAYDHIAVWVGPGHIQSFVRGEPNCMVIDSANDKLKRKLADSFKSNLIRFYYGNDLIGTEIGAAAKNVMGIAAGALDAICPSLKGPLITRGAREVATLIKAMGGNELSAYGLAHLGDYETTLFSPYSHNRQYGENLAKGQRFEKLAEGVATSKAMRLLGKKYHVEMPITDAVYHACFGWGDDEKRFRDEIGKLFARKTKAEWD